MPRRKRVPDEADADYEDRCDMDLYAAAAAKPKAARKSAGGDTPRARAPKAPRKEPEDRRTAPDGVTTVRKLGAPSLPVQQRIARALPGSSHRMFLVSTKELRPSGAPGGRAHEFTVLGATANVYNIEISRNPCCSCPDFAKGNLCKHILFVYLRALKMAPHNELIWQRALLTKEVEDILSGRHSTASNSSDVVASAAVRSQYARLMGHATADAAGGGGGGGGGKSVRRPVEGDCPVCFDELRERGGEAISWCASCGNNIHSACAREWADAKRAQRARVTCCYCRADWRDGSKPGEAAAPGGGAAEAAIGGRAYINLAEYSEAHRGANVSLYDLYPETAQYITGEYRRDSFGSGGHGGFSGGGGGGGGGYGGGGGHRAGGSGGGRRRGGQRQPAAVDEDELIVIDD